MEITEAREQIKKHFEAEIARQLEQIPSMIQEVIEQAVLSIIGIRKTHDGYCVSNIGPHNPLSRYIQDTTDRVVRENVEPLVSKELSRLLKFKTLPRDIVEEAARSAERAFQSTVRRRLTDGYDKLARGMCARIDEHFKEILSEINEINEDVFDPSSFDGVIGEILLEEKARVLAEFDQP